MKFAIPYMTIDPIRDKLKIGTQLDIMAVDPVWSYRLSDELLEAPLELTVELGRRASPCRSHQPVALAIPSCWNRAARTS